MVDNRPFLSPENEEQIGELVRNHRRVLPVGGSTKPSLSQMDSELALIDMKSISGIVEYEPEEYTVTARAGTPLRDVARELASHGQFFPFDPPFLEVGSTIGGTVASGLSGAGRHRYGGLRDFILGVHIVDGRGERVRGGGKVVKNAAGFDLPKLMVGSLGRLGIMTSVSFKVFPRPEQYATARLHFDSFSEAHQALIKLTPRPFEFAALELEASGDIVFRIGGRPTSLELRLNRIERFLDHPLQRLKSEREPAYWSDYGHFGWIPDTSHLVKVPLTIKRIPELEAFLSESQCDRRYSAGGNIAWIGWNGTESIDELHHVLQTMELAGLVLRGHAKSPTIGHHRGREFLRRIQKAIDPEGRFPPFDTPGTD